MLNNYIGGGQVFLHKVRMFLQVFRRSIHASLLFGIVLALAIYLPQLMGEDLVGAYSFRKAVLAEVFDDAMNPVRESLSLGRGHRKHVTTVDVRNDSGVSAKDLTPRKVMAMRALKKADRQVMDLLAKMAWFAALASLGTFCLIFLLWWKFGKSIKSDHKIKGGQVLNAGQVSRILCGLNMASSFKIGDMPLVKDSETRHFLICGSTGSGKTNLIDTILPQVASKSQPAVVIDQTGEMISKYYDEKRGDIIFNPLDDRTHCWDFWADCFEESISVGRNNERLEKFAKILFGFNRKSGGSNYDPFWENSAEAVFISCAEHAFFKKERSISVLQDMLQRWNLSKLERALTGTSASRYLSAPNKVTASSILSVVTTSSKPLKYLTEGAGCSKFSLHEYVSKAREGNKAWLFLATKPSQRELTLPLIACQLELAVSMLMERGAQEGQRIWFILDELAALGRLPALSGLMAEGRKYGACVMAAMQSLNQLYLNYGQYEGSAIFGQFGTKFFFRNDEPQIAKMITEMCGTELINRQQKNTSFGANEFRDGVSYTEQEKHKNLVDYSDIASLDVGQCYALLPEPKTRLAKIEVPFSRIEQKNKGYIQHPPARPQSVCCGEELEPEEDVSESEPGAPQFTKVDYEGSEGENGKTSLNNLAALVEHEPELDKI